MQYLSVDISVQIQSYIFIDVQVSFPSQLNLLGAQCGIATFKGFGDSLAKVTTKDKLVAAGPGSLGMNLLASNRELRL